MFGRYTPDHYDKFHYLKAPVGFYGLLVVLLRPYIVWVVSLGNRENGTLLLEALYPDKQAFITGLAVGVGAILVTFMFSLRREKTFAWQPKVWPYGPWLLWLSLLSDIAVTFMSLKRHHFSYEPQLALVSLALIFSTWYLLRSEHLKDFFNDWPEEIESEQ